MPIEIVRERKGGVLILAVSGRLDGEGAADFELAAQEAVAAGERHLLLDFADLGYMSNAGVRALASLSKSLATPTTSLRVAGLQPTVQQALDAAGVGLLLDLHRDRAAALNSHPAARGDALAQDLARLLGISAPTAAMPAQAAEVKLAELAFELLSGAQHQHRAARAVAQGTQVLQRVAAAPAAANAASRPAPAAKKLSFWQRWFGRRR